MPTFIRTREQFIDWLTEEFPEEAVFLFTADIEEASAHKRRNVQKVSYLFAADAFKRPDCIGHFTMGESRSMAVAVIDREKLSQKALHLIAE